MGKKKRAAKESTPRAWKVMSRVAEKLSGSAGKKLVDASWRAATGKQPPVKPESPEIALRESIAWTVLSAAGVELVKTLATRRAAVYFAQSTGQLPPPLRTPREPPAE